MQKKRKEHLLLDTLAKELKLRNDAAIAVFMEWHPSAVCKIRYGSCRVTAALMLDVYDKTGWSIEHIRDLVAASAKTTRKEKK